MKIGEFREKTKDLPDDTEIHCELEEFKWYEVNVDVVLPPVLEHSYAVLLHPGQCWNMELDLEARYEAFLHLGDG